MKKRYLILILVLFFSSEIIVSQNKVVLQLSDGTSSNTTDIRYFVGTTIGLDPGFDAGVFGGVSSNTEIATRLVDGSSSVNFDIQALPDENYSSMIVPLVVKSSSGTQTEITIDSSTLPANHNVFIEDREAFTFTLLSVPTGVVTYTPTTSSEIVGRFYLHVTEKDLVANGTIFTPTSGDWLTASNWSANQVPSLASVVSIPSGKTLTINDDTNLVDSFHNDGTTIIEAGKKLEVSDNFVNSNSVTISSDATSSGSLLVGGLTVGNIIYDRYISTNWHLISSPVEGQDIDTFVSASSLVISTTNTNRKGLGNYNNQNPGWEYYQGNVNDSFKLTDGYTIKSTVAGTKQFTGTINLNDIENITISDNSATGNKWNLVGNPYPNFLLLSEFLSVNSDSFEPSFVLIYLWDAENGKYELANNLPETQQFVAPGQAFFVNAKDGGANIKFTKAMQTHQSGDLFLRSNLAKLSLIVSSHNQEKAAQFYFLDNTTNGLDKGYDAGLFGGTDSDFSIYSRLVDGNNDTKFATQSLAKEAQNDVIIPIGVKINETKTLGFSIEKMNVSDATNVYLEDKITNAFILLNTQNYSVNVEPTEIGHGRFYLHLTNKVLSASSVLPVNISVENNNNTITINGLANQNVGAKIFNIQGKEVLNLQRVFNQNEMISLPKIASGVYVLQLNYNSQTFTKKLVIR